MHRLEETGMDLYWTDVANRYFEFEATTKGGIYGWFRNLATDESVRLRLKDLMPVPTEHVLALAKAGAL
jgi:hypothetical protein